MRPFTKWWLRKVMEKKWANSYIFLLSLVFVPATLITLSLLYGAPLIWDSLRQPASQLFPRHLELLGVISAFAIAILIYMPFGWAFSTLVSRCYLPEVAARQAANFAVEYPGVKERLDILVQDAWRVDDAAQLQEFLEKLRSLGRLKNEFREADEKLSALQEKIAALEKELEMK